MLSDLIKNLVAHVRKLCLKAMNELMNLVSAMSVGLFCYILSHCN